MKEITTKNIEIRLNPIGKFEKCSICGEYDEELEICSNNIGYPDLFLPQKIFQNAWVCRFCANSISPQLFSLIELAREIESFSSILYETNENSFFGSTKSLKFQIAIRFEQIPNNFEIIGNSNSFKTICGICNEEAYFEIPMDFEMGFLELFIDDSMICYDCAKGHNPLLFQLFIIAETAKTHGGTRLFSNNSPVKTAELDRKGWLTCPSCQKRFAIKDSNRWKYNRHLTCGQKIQIISEN